MLEGTVVGGRYAVGRQLGEGGMGQVFEARHLTTGRRVALKLISPDLARNPAVVARLQLEAQTAASIESEYVAHVLDVGRDEELGQPFLVLEFLEGRDLEATLRETGPLAPAAVISIGIQICLALERAHEKGILHRDIKPANVFLSRRDRGEIRVKLLDFGIAKVLESGDAKPRPKLTGTGMLIGSPLYMSPEQARGRDTLTPASDVWSVGVVLYQALVGETPVEPTDALGDLVVKIITEPPRPVASRAPWVPAPLAAIVDRALTHDKTQRYAGGRELGDALRALSREGWALSESMLVPASRQPVATGGEPPRPTAPGPTVPGVPLVASQLPYTPPSKTVPQPEPVGGTTTAPFSMSQLDVAKPALPPAPAASPAKRSLVLPIALGVGALAIAGFAGSRLLTPPKSDASSLAVEETARAPSSSTSDNAPPPVPTAHSSDLGKSFGPTASSNPAPPSPLERLVGRYKTDTGNRFEAVLQDGKLEFRVIDPKQFARQGYAANEVRFALVTTAKADEFTVEDHVRPAIRQGTFDGGVSPASCLRVVTEVKGQALVAKRDGDNLDVDLVSIGVPQFVNRGSSLVVVECKGMDAVTTTRIRGKLRRETP
ncbi:MAG: protein kinase [Polyangiaceae bacterium]